jgi:hypothetical protein
MVCWFICGRESGWCRWCVVSMWKRGSPALA